MMMNQTPCGHDRAEPLDLVARITHHASLVHLIEQAFPAFPADEVDEVIASPAFAFARCPDCESFLVRLAE